MEAEKRECRAIIDVEFAGDVNIINVCGVTACEKPFPTYIPLCTAHRLIATASEIKVLTDRVIATYRL